MTWCIAYTSVVQYKIWLPRQQPANIDYNPSARSSRELSDPLVVFLPRLERMPWARAQPVTPDDHSELVPLLPIPNRTVKRLCADDSGRTSVKVGHRQAFIAQNPAAHRCGVLFLWARKCSDASRADGLRQVSAGHGPATVMARARHEYKKGPAARAAGPFTLNRCARAGRLPSRPHAGRLLVTTRPVREALWRECGPHRSIRDADAKSATDLQRGFSASYFRRTAALERGNICF